jgi:Cu(I)/Ag(I) efflux system periplasmic protein CusF
MEAALARGERGERVGCAKEDAMRAVRNRGGAAALLLAALGAAECSAKTNEGEGTGIVRALGAGGTTITLEHGEIPGLMMGMTMEFAVAKPELLAGIEVGETVEFHLVHEGDTYTVTELREAKP